MPLGAQIAELRHKKGESLQEVADAVEVSKAHVWDLERGRAGNPSMLLVQRLADHFGISVAFLVGEDPKAAGANPALAGMFRRAAELSEADRALVDQMMKMLIQRQRKGANKEQ